MLKILVNSYTCCPNMGSEQGMGWNWITSLAMTGEVELFVISEGEYRDQCEASSKDLPIHWYWNPVSEATRNKCWNQGNWSFYPLYAKWQQKTANIARDICIKHHIDILHQLNMIGFREPGYLADVSIETGIPLVWGPIGGLKMFPLEYAKDGGIKMRTFTWLKNTITKWQIKHHKRVIRTLKQSSLLISSIPDSYNAIKLYHGLESYIIPETGCFISKIKDDENNEDNRFLKESLTILWVGKFDYRKRIDIAIKTISSLTEIPIVLKVFGTGNEQQINRIKRLTISLGIEDKIIFMGACPNKIVTQEMRKADLFFFTSVNEDTSTVVLEAISNKLPVLCFDACGMSAVIDESVGKKIPLTNPKQSIKYFSDAILSFYNNRKQLIECSNNCSNRSLELSWENKAKNVLNLYNEALKQ